MRTLQQMCQDLCYEPINMSLWQDLTACELSPDFKKELNKLVEELKEKYNYKELTELVLFLNWKLWETYNKWYIKIAEVYNDIWEETNDYAYENLKDEELKYFIRTTD